MPRRMPRRIRIPLRMPGRIPRQIPCRASHRVPGRAPPRPPSRPPPRPTRAAHHSSRRGGTRCGEEEREGTRAPRLFARGRDNKGGQRRAERGRAVEGRPRQARALSAAASASGGRLGRDPSPTPWGPADLGGKRLLEVRRSRQWRRQQRRVRADRGELEPRNASSVPTVWQRFRGGWSRGDSPATRSACGGRPPRPRSTVIRGKDRPRQK